MRTFVDLLLEAQANLDQTPVSDTFALAAAVAHRDTMRILVARMAPATEVIQ